MVGRCFRERRLIRSTGGQTANVLWHSLHGDREARVANAALASFCDSRILECIAAPGVTNFGGLENFARSHQKTSPGSVARGFFVCGAPSEPVVDPELDRGNALLDVNAWHHFGDASNRPGECQIARVEVVEIIFNFCRPVVPKGPFQTAANCPAWPRNTGFDVFVKGR